MRRDGLIGALAKPPEKSREGGHRSHLCPTKDLAQGRIKAHQGGRRNVHAAHPDHHQKTFHHEHRRIAAIGQRLGQGACGQHLPEVQSRQKLLHQPHHTPSGDRFVRKDAGKP
jgi:hypothetical protein